MSAYKTKTGHDLLSWRNRKHIAGFTLVELIIVITVLAIFSVIAFDLRKLTASNNE